MRYKKIEQQLFIDNRQKLCKKLKPNSVVILNSNDQFPRNGDQLHKFRQNSDIFWASGLDQEETIVLLYPDCPVKTLREVAFVIKTNDQIAIWEGHKLTKAEAKEISGIQNIQWLEAFENILSEVMTYTDHIYLNANEYPKFKTEVPYRDIRFTEWIQKRYPNHHYERLAPILMQQRLIKHPVEIRLIKEACLITEKAFYRVLNTVKPGQYEFEVQAEIDHELTINRASGHAYDPIIASGENALCLHYTENNSKCEEGELMLLDFGAEYANYAADLSRTIPVNGKFNQRQKDCYEAVLKVWKQAKELFIVGSTIEMVNEEVNKMMEQEMIKLGLFSEDDVAAQDPEKPLYAQYFMHGTSHFMGLDVHDVGSKQTVFETGMVLSCEPGLYIPEENIGIRVETDILITDHGPEDLMEHVPVEVDEIENLML